MNRDDIRKLIGGYATGSLTEAERRILFEAVLDDQELFDELAREQALKELIEEPGARQRLIAALGRPESIVARVAWWKRPWPWAAAATAVLAAALIVVMLPHTVKRTEVAMTRQPAPEPAHPAAEAEHRAPIIRDAAPARPRKEKAVAAPAAPHADADKKEMDAQSSPPPAQQSAQQVQQAPQAQQSFAAEVQSQRFRAQGQLPSSAPVSGLRETALSSTSAKSGAIKAPRFAFDYSLEGNRLVIKPAADGYLLVTSSSPASLDRIFPLNDSGRVLSGSTTTVQVPAGSKEVLVTFSRSADLADSINALAISKDSASGTAEDPNPSANSRIVLKLKLP